jgi:DNA-binding beta-propeller fold protein YncE
MISDKFTSSKLTSYYFRVLFLRTFILGNLLLFFAGCAGTDLQTRTSELQTPDTAPAWPPPPQAPRIQYVRSVSGPADIGVKKSWFKRAVDALLGKEDIEEGILKPYGVFAGNDRLYVTDTGAHLLHVFDRREERYFQIKEAKKEELVSPIGVAADKNGEIYLSDSVLHEVFVFDKEGKYLREIGTPELFVRPAGIALDEERIYVVDTHGHQVLVFSRKTGEFLSRFGKNGTGQGDFNYPTNIFIKDGLVYISDSMNFRVQIFGKDGGFLSAFGKPGDGSGDFSKPRGIAVDSEGHVYVADAHFDAVQIFDREGRLLLVFGSTGRRIGEMSLPAGMFIDEKDMVYVTDSYNNRVQVFQYLKEKK